MRKLLLWVEIDRLELLLSLAHWANVVTGKLSSILIVVAERLLLNVSSADTVFTARRSPACSLTLRLDYGPFDQWMVEGCLDFFIRLLSTSFTTKQTTSDHVVFLKNLHLKGSLIFAKGDARCCHKVDMTRIDAL